MGLFSLQEMDLELYNQYTSPQEIAKTSNGVICFTFNFFQRNLMHLTVRLICFKSFFVLNCQDSDTNRQKWTNMSVVIMRGCAHEDA